MQTKIMDGISVSMNKMQISADGEDTSNFWACSLLKVKEYSTPKKAIRLVTKCSKRCRHEINRNT